MSILYENVANATERELGSVIFWTTQARSAGEKVDLSEADLSEADLRIYGQPWELTVYPSVIAIGCERHTVAKWAGFSDAQIGAMDSRALTWWRQWKNVILAVVEANKPENKT